jgi:outer membrane lipoprotein SlyB
MNRASFTRPPVKGVVSAKRERGVVVSALFAVFLTACTYNPIIDAKTSKHPERFDADLAECRALAEQAPAGGKVAGGAGVGALVGAGVAVATGHSDAAGRAAGGGAVIGGAKGAGASNQEKTMIVRNCLKGRGYAVLN